MRVVVVDDEPLARSGVKRRLEQIPDVEIIADCGSGNEAVSAICGLRPDLIFLDVQMPDLSGFDVLREIPATKLPFVIFLTAYDKYALQAFSIHATDYLLKPIDDVRFAQAMEQARAQISSSATAKIEQRMRELLQEIGKETLRPTYRTRFVVRAGRRIAIIPVEDIDWIEAADDYVALHVGGHCHLLRETMSQVESSLDPELFIRIHRSTIVQVTRICELEALPNREYLLRLSNGIRLKTSRRFSDRIAQWL